MSPTEHPDLIPEQNVTQVTAATNKWVNTNDSAATKC